MRAKALAPEASVGAGDAIKQMVVIITVLALYVLFYSLIGLLQGWSFADALYFSVITFTTVLPLPRPLMSLGTRNSFLRLRPPHASSQPVTRLHAPAPLPAHRWGWEIWPLRSQRIAQDMPTPSARSRAAAPVGGGD